MNAAAHEYESIYRAVATAITDRLPRNERVRRNLPGSGRLRIDRQLPFLVCHRFPADGPDLSTRELVTTEAAYLTTPGDGSHHAALQRLVSDIAETMLEFFSKFLLIEVWADGHVGGAAANLRIGQPAFRIVTADDGELNGAIEVLSEALGEVKVRGWPAAVEVVTAPTVSPPGREPLLDHLPGVHVLGLAVRPVYREAAENVVFPAVLRSLRRQLAAAMRRAVFAFSGQQRQSPSYFEALGPSSMVKAARLVDQQLSEVSQAFDFVLQTVPLNARVAWDEFAAAGFRKPPAFHYRPLPYDPADLKRKLYEVSIDRIEDATLIHLFLQKQEHLDRQLSALRNLGRPLFYHDSVHLYAPPDDSLVSLARGLLAMERPDRPGRGDLWDAAQVVTAAREEIDYYRQRLPDFIAKVELRDDVAASMMVVQDRLFISADARLGRRQVEPLLHHEIGTHMLTYFNGRQQPIQQLFTGLAKYEELQEGLAVFAEFLSGSLTFSRLRVLACRVLAVHALEKGRSFLETFQLLHDGCSASPRSAFMTALRVYRGGGLTKDVIYLRGLLRLHQYISQGHELEPLYIGKIAFEHAPAMRELRLRGMVKPPALLPRCLESADAAPRLEQCRRTPLLDLLEQSP